MFCLDWWRTVSFFWSQETSHIIKSSFPVSVTENIPFQSLTHFQAFKNSTTLWAAVVNLEKRLICLAPHHWKPLTLLTPRRDKFLTEWRRMLQKRFAMFFSNLRNNLCTANLQSTDWDKWSWGSPALCRSCQDLQKTVKCSKYFKVQQVLGSWRIRLWRETVEFRSISDISECNTWTVLSLFCTRSLPYWAQRQLQLKRRRRR